MGENYTAEEYREVLKEIYNMCSAERKKTFGVDTVVQDYTENFSASELIEKYRAYNVPKVGEYWKREMNGEMVVVWYVEKNAVYVYFCDDCCFDYFSRESFVDSFTRTEHKSKYLESLIEEMKGVSK